MTSWQFLIGFVLTTLTMLASLSGCTTPTTTSIMVPVATPKINSIRKPELSIKKTKKNDASPEVIKSYVLSLNQAISYSHQQEEIIKELNHEKP